jgi:hypothetical protein
MVRKPSIESFATRTVWVVAMFVASPNIRWQPLRLRHGSVPRFLSSTHEKSPKWFRRGRNLPLHGRYTAHMSAPLAYIFADVRFRHGNAQAFSREHP